MREISVTEVRAGDIARSNGKELRVMGVFAPISLIRCEGDDPFEFVWTWRDLAALGVTFWREERALPDYPVAVVVSGDRDRFAVRVGDLRGILAPWLTTDRHWPWKTEPELLEWLGHDWQETTTPPAREWTPVDTDQVREGDFVRFEWADGDAVEGFVTEDGDEHEVGELGISVIPAERGQWFKREEQTDERG